MSVLPPPERLEKDHLRHVEKDVLIPKKLRAVGMQICSEYVEGCFTNHIFAYFTFVAKYRNICKCEKMF